MDSSILLLCLVGLITHLPILLDRGFYGDGWWYDWAVQQKRWDKLKTFFAEVGLHLNYYWIRSFYQIGGWNSFRGLAVGCLLIQSIAFSISLSLLPGFPSAFVLPTALLFLLYPSDHSPLDVVVTTQYHLMQTFYWIGAALLAYSINDPSNITWRALALLFIGVSFHANSLLVFHYGILIIYTGLCWLVIGSDIKEIISNTFEQWLIPIIFWIYKEKVTPRHGAYQNYNRIHLSISRIIFGIGSSFYYPYWKTFMQSIKDQWSFPWGIFLVGSVWLVGIPLIKPIPYSSNDYFGIALFIVGIFLTICGSTSYAVVGLTHPHEGIGTRYNLLLRAPFALGAIGILITISQHFFENRSEVFVSLWIGLALVLWIHWIMIYGCYFCHTSKYFRFLEILRSIPVSERSEWVGIEDHAEIPWVTCEKQDAYWTSIIQSVWGKPAFAINGSIDNKSYKTLKDRWKATTSGEFLGALPETKKRINFEIKWKDLNMESAGAWRFALKGWKTVILRMFYRDKYPLLLEKDLSIKSSSFCE